MSDNPQGLTAEEIERYDGQSPFPWSETSYVPGTSVCNPSSMLLAPSGECLGVVVVLNAKTNLQFDVQRALSASSNPAKLRRYMQIARKEAEEYHDQLTAANARIAELEEALRPFVRYFNWLQRRGPIDDPDDENWFHDDGGELTAGEFRRAARLLPAPEQTESRT